MSDSTLTRTPDTESLPVEVRPKTPREVGEHAARYIEEHGWHQGGFVADGAVCIYGALNTIIGGAPDRVPPYDGLWASVVNPLLDHTGFGGLSAWNDAPERTEAEVLAALRAIR